MPIRMTQQQVAEWILDILVKDLWLKPGTPVPDHQLREKYRARKADSADQGGAEVRRGTRVVEVRPDQGHLAPHRTGL